MSGVQKRFGNVVAWTGFTSLSLGLIPFLILVIGAQLESLQAEAPKIISYANCLEDITNKVEARGDDAANKNSNTFYLGLSAIDFFDIEPLEVEECKDSGSSTATAWSYEGKTGWFYERLSERELRSRLGYRTFFQEQSYERFFFFGFVAFFWLPIILFNYIFFGRFRALPWAQVTDDD